MKENERIKYQIELVKKMLVADENIIQTTASKENEKLKPALIGALILIVIGILLIIYSKKAVTINEYISTHKKYSYDDSFYKTDAEITSDRRNKALVGFSFILTGIALFFYASAKLTKRYYFLTNTNKIAFPVWGTGFVIIKTDEIKDVKSTLNEKVIVITNIGVEYVLDDCVTELINNKNEVIHKPI